MKALLRNWKNASDMEHMTLKQLPVGIQTFSKLVEQDCLYIDKTEYICKMIKVSKYIFLSRPRRFGKSLLVSTLQAYFEGRKDLFKGLYIYKAEKEWKEYPYTPPRAHRRGDEHGQDHLSLFELKLNKSAEAATQQIGLKDYVSKLSLMTSGCTQDSSSKLDSPSFAQKFSLSQLPVVKVGINFDAERRTLGEWEIEY